MYICTGQQVLTRIRGHMGKLQPHAGRERAFEALKNGQGDVTKRPEKDTKDRRTANGVVKTTSSWSHFFLPSTFSHFFW